MMKTENTREKKDLLCKPTIIHVNPLTSCQTDTGLIASLGCIIQY